MPEAVQAAPITNTTLTLSPPPHSSSHLLLRWFPSPNFIPDLVARHLIQTIGDTLFS